MNNKLEEVMIEAKKVRFYENSHNFDNIQINKLLKYLEETGYTVGGQDSGLIYSSNACRQRQDYDGFYYKISFSGDGENYTIEFTHYNGSKLGTNVYITNNNKTDERFPGIDYSEMYKN